jgi:hypothetical protein
VIFLDQVLFGIGLLQDPRFVESLQRVQMAVTGHDDDRHVGPPGLDLPRELDAIPGGHREVGENDIDLDAACDQPSASSPPAAATAS